jgi:Na+-driven multidrug efflux pump
MGEVVWGFNNLMRTYFIGHYSSTVIAAFSVINTLSETAFICILAMESAAGILTGKMIGIGKREEIKPYAHYMQVIFLIIGAVAVLFLYGIRGPFISLYQISTQSRQEAFRLSNVMIPIVLFSTYEDMTLCGIVKYGGETSFVLKTDSILVFLVMLPLCLAASHAGASPTLMFFLLQLDQILKCGVAFVKVNRFDWAHSLTD